MDCFVIMPFGEKKDANGKLIDFDDIYKYLIKNTVEELELGIKCTRCDEIAESGWIHSKMFDHIYKSDIAVVDITALNPNVFYELGVRHALADFVTVLVRRKGTKLPFNIQDFTVIDYDQKNLASTAEARKKIGDFIRNGIKLRQPDSPVHSILKIKINTEATKLTKLNVFGYTFQRGQGKQLCLVTGDIQGVKKVADVWVSSENTNMQMSRHYERSVSGVVRYLGARKNKAGKIIEDTIAKELCEIVGDNANVPPGTIIATGAGLLKHTHGVKKIFHAASVVGTPGAGYAPIADIEMCVWNSLEKIDSGELKGLDVKSILFPLIGTGQARGSLEEIAKKLIGKAISYVEGNPDSKVTKIYFLTWSDRELKVCQRILQEAPEVAIH